MSWNKRKAMLAMLYISAKQDWRIDLYQLMKTIFWADKLHLQKWGELITDDVYKQSKYGPVPFNAYKLVVNLPRDNCAIDLRDLVTDHGRDSLTIEKIKYELAQSEIDALDMAYEIFQGQDFNNIKRIVQETEYPPNQIISLEVLAEGDEELISYMRSQDEYKMALGQ